MISESRIVLVHRKLVLAVCFTSPSALSIQTRTSFLAILCSREHVLRMHRHAMDYTTWHGNSTHPFEI